MRVTKYKIFALEPTLLLKIFILSTLLVLGGAFVSEHYFNLRPCSLCQLQQYIYAGIFCGSLATLLVPFIKKQMLKIIVILVTLYGLNTGVALYQVAVEQHWVSLPSLCKNRKLTGDSIDALREQLLQTETVPCDRVQWSLFGISMAGYSAFYSLSLSMLGLYFLSKRQRRSRSL